MNSRQTLAETSKTTNVGNLRKYHPKNVSTHKTFFAKDSSFTVMILVLL